MKQIPKLGRPPKIKHVKQLDQLIDDFIESCYITDVTKKGVEYQRNIQPLTVRGFCVFANLHFDTLLEWEKKRQDLSESVKMLKQICHAFAEQKLFQHDAPTIGVIFNLKNNWGWQDQKQLEIKNTNLKFDFNEDSDIESLSDDKD